MNRPFWKDLEKLLESSQDIQVDVARKYPKEMVKWSVLRARQGRFCPMARGVLKLICYMEMGNKDFKEALEKQEWKDGILTSTK